MAMRGRPIDGYTLRLILRLARDVSIRGAARIAMVSRNTVRRYTRTK